MRVESRGQEGHGRRAAGSAAPEHSSSGWCLVTPVGVPEGGVGVGEGWPGPGGKEWCTQRDGGAGGCRRRTSKQAIRARAGGAGRRQAGRTHLQGTGGRAWQGSVRGAAGAALRAPNGGRGAGEDKGTVHESKCSDLAWTGLRGVPTA